MRPFKRSYARYMRILLLMLALLLLTACKHSVKPYVEPTPPQVSCASQAPAVPLPPIPDPLNLDTAQVWMGKAVGVYQIEVTRRATTAECLDGLRKTGVIR